MDELDIIAKKHGTDKSTNEHGYTPYYERLLSHLRNKPVELLEIGVRQGWSHQMWTDYFPYGKISGIDNCFESEFNSNHAHLTAKNIIIYYGNQEDKEFLDSALQDTQFDIIIDDGGHQMHEHQLSLIYLFDKLKSGGIYFIEDLHTCSSPTYYRSSLFPQDSTVQFLNALNHEHTHTTSHISSDMFSYIKNNISGVEFLTGSLAAIYKK